MRLRKLSRTYELPEFMFAQAIVAASLTKLLMYNGDLPKQTAEVILYVAIQMVHGIGEGMVYFISLISI